MEEEPRLFLKYSVIRDLPSVRQLRTAEIPIEHAVSLALPTCRWYGPAYVQFAAPSARTPAARTKQARPDRWWLIDARTGRLWLYALIAVSAPKGFPESETASPTSPGRSLPDQSRLVLEIGRYLDILGEPFFSHQPGDARNRQELARLLQEFLPEPLQPQYHFFAADFFQWLNG